VAVKNNAGLYGMLGDLYFGRGNFEQAVSAYRSALELEPENALVLNNYAWLLATCEDLSFRDSELALELAERAAAIEQSPHIMDTLAESLFINGQVDEAIAASTTARSLARTNLQYYDGQLEKFQAARDNPVTE
jgi:Tfp pilus assembly protein PilF